MTRLGISTAAIALVWAASASAQKSTLSFQVGGKARHASLFVPSGINKPAVVFFVHGANGSGSNFENETKGDVTAEREKFIAVYPSASGTGAAGVWEDMSGTGNFPFFLAILDTLAARHAIDRNRVYMTGFSQGGFISFVAGCRYSDVFAAVAPVSGHAGATCTLKRPVPVYMTFGAGEGPSGFVADLNVWRNLNTCPATPTITRPYPATKPNSKVSRITYGPCAQGTSVVMDSVSGQGHQWPSATTQNQADEVWAFFKQYSLGATSGVRDLRGAHSQGLISAAYFGGVVSLQGMKEDTRVRVTDVRGGLVASTRTSGGRFAFKDMPSGVYTVVVAGSEDLAPGKFLVP
jgi:poly(3-hydroxybutyrate) depolymerase